LGAFGRLEQAMALATRSAASSPNGTGCGWLQRPQTRNPLRQGQVPDASELAELLQEVAKQREEASKLRMQLKLQVSSAEQILEEGEEDEDEEVEEVQLHTIEETTLQWEPPMPQANSQAQTARSEATPPSALNEEKEAQQAHPEQTRLKTQERQQLSNVQPKIGSPRASAWGIQGLAPERPGLREKLLPVRQSRRQPPQQRTSSPSPLPCQRPSSPSPPQRQQPQKQPQELQGQLRGQPLQSPQQLQAKRQQQHGQQPGQNAQPRQLRQEQVEVSRGLTQIQQQESTLPRRDPSPLLKGSSVTSSAASTATRSAAASRLCASVPEHRLKPPEPPCLFSLPLRVSDGPKQLVDLCFRPRERSPPGGGTRRFSERSSSAPHRRAGSRSSSPGPQRSANQEISQPHRAQSPLRAMSPPVSPPRYATTQLSTAKADATPGLATPRSGSPSGWIWPVGASDRAISPAPTTSVSPFQPNAWAWGATSAAAAMLSANRTSTAVACAAAR